MTAELLAEQVGVSPVTVWAWESGARQLKPDQARKVLAVLAANGVHAGFDALYGMRAA